MSRSAKKKTKLKIRKNSLLYKLILVTFLLIIILNILRYAAYFKKEDSSIKVMIQNEVNVELENEIYIDDKQVVYLSEADIKKYFDKNLYYEINENNKRKYFSLAQNKLLEITEDENCIHINSQQINISGKLMKKDGIYYFPISELVDVYNLDVNYIAENRVVNIEKLSEENIVAVVNRDIKLKYKMTDISRTVKLLEQGEVVTVIEEMNSKWVRVKTSDYKVGYVKKSKLLEYKKERAHFDVSNQYFNDFDMSRDIILEPDESVYENFNDKISTYEGRKEICMQLSSKMKDVITNSDLSNKYIGIKIRKIDIQKTEDYYRFLEELRVYANSNGCFLIVEKPDKIDESRLKEITDLII